MRLVMISALVALACACAKDPGKDTKAAAAGAERGPCYGNGTCNEGLVCLSDLCVRPPPADCQEVAKRVGYLTLSNYAPKDERYEFEQSIVTECKDAHLTKEEGDCILRAEDKGQLAGCPKPLGVGSCKKIIAHIQENLAPKDPEVQKFLAQGGDQLLEECQREAPTKAMELCALKATSMDELKDCD